jgi:four helix bundle protein
MSTIKRFEDLHCWQEARELVRLVYAGTNVGLFKRDFEMKGQIRRAAISVMNNIAEGFGRMSKRDFIRFLEISQTSANEVKSIAYAALDQNYWTPETAKIIQDRAEDVKSLDLGLIRYLAKKTKNT